MRKIEKLKEDFAASAETDFLSWLEKQPEGNINGNKSETVKKTMSVGLGDTIAKMTKAVGIQPCGGCKKRQEWLNKKVPYKTRILDDAD